MINTTFINIRDELLNEKDEITIENINKCPEVDIRLNGVTVRSLIDTGSQINAISEEWFRQNQNKMGNYETLKMTNTTIKGAVGQRSKAVTQQVLLEVEVGKYKFDSVFIVVPELIKECILGIELLNEGKCIVNIPNKQIIFNKPSEENQENVVLEIMGIDFEKQNGIENLIEEKLEEISIIPEESKQKLKRILMDNRIVFRDAPGRIKEYTHQIRVTDPTPYCLKGWPVPFNYQDAVDQEINKMMEHGIIERAASPYVNPMVTVIKKDQTVRLCLDARRLNSVTLPDYEGAIPINELLGSCGKIQVMSSVDLTSSFWQMPLEEASRDYTAFMYKGKCYRYTVTPFGLKTSLASLTRGLDTILSEEVKKFTVIYVDDCLCISNSVDEHIQHLKLLLENFRRENITVNFKKSQFFRKSINYLGYILETTGIRASPDKIVAIQNFPQPRNQKQLKGFLGLTNFYNKFTSKYAEATQPLLQLLKKNTKFKWSEELEHQFNKVKNLFLETVMLKHADPNKRFYLQTDASKYALGGQLYQIDDEQQIGVIAFISRTFKGSEISYSTTEKELLAIVHCLKKVRMYVLGKPLTIVTDNKALTFIKKCHLNNSRITRWVLGIQEYDFEIVHCKGIHNVVADVLSRYPEDLYSNQGMTMTEELEINAIKIQISSEMKSNLKNIYRHQNNDEKLAKVIDTIKSDKPSKINERYKIFNNKLYRKDRGRWKLMIPINLSRQIIKDIHVAYGHVGCKKTLQLFQEYFTCNAANKMVKQAIKPCDACQKCKDYGKAAVGETKAVIPKAKGELISMDYYGPLPTSSGGVKFLLIMVDNFTKYVKLYAIKRATTTITVNKLRQYISQYGKPGAVLTDNGTQFTSRRWTKELNNMEIKTKFTAIRNPCTNLAERVNRQLGNMFRILAGERHTTWAKYINLVEACLNQTYHETIETTPYEIQCGQKPERDWRKYLDPEMIQEEPLVDKQDVYLRIKEKGTNRANKLNARNNIVKFNIGDLVLVKACQTSDAVNRVISKFCKLYNGPFRVQTKIGNATYMLEYVDKPGEVRGTFNVRQLKPYFKE